MLVLKIRIVGIDGVQLPQVTSERIRFELKVLAVLDIAEAVRGDVLRQQTCDAMPVLRPISRLVGMRNVALQDNSPGPDFTRTGLGKIQAGERNAQEYDVPGRRAFTPGVPHGVEGVVGTILFTVKTVGLNAECIAAKQ